MKNNNETVDFQSSDQQDNIMFVPTTDMLGQYNHQYSLIVRQVEKFFKQTTECIQRFVAFHNFGVNFNLNQLLGNIVCMENSFKSRLANTQGNQEKDQKSIAKNKYQITFNRLIQRMTDIFHDLIDCQIQFKKTYFGIKNQQHNFHTQERVSLARSPVAYSVSSMTKSSKSVKENLQDFIQSEEKEQTRQAQLRATLNEKLKPQAATTQKQCKQDYSTTQNLYRLNEKIDRFIIDIKTTRSRQQKLIELFNLNRIKKIHSSAEEVTGYTTSEEVSQIEPRTDEDDKEEMMDSFLESCRQVRKDSDSYTEKGMEGRRFFKKRPTLIKERK